MTIFRIDGGGKGGARAAYDQDNQQADPSVPAVFDRYTLNHRLYPSLVGAFPGRYISLFGGVTHYPRSYLSDSCAQLDYVFCVFNSEVCPNGKSKSLWTNFSDHLAVVVRNPHSRYMY